MTLKRKRILITGPTSGLGKATAKQLIDAGHQVILACRNLDEGRRLKALWQKNDPDQIHVMYINLLSLDSIAAFGKVFYEKFAYLDVLIHNAGVYEERKGLTEEKINPTLMVNFLAPYLISKILIGGLKLGREPLIINVVSKAGFHGRLCLKETFFNSKAGGFKAYADSKLALMMATYHDHKAYSEQGIVMLAVQPGVVKTKIFNGKTFMMKLNKLIMNFIAKVPEQACETLVYMAQTPEVMKYGGQLLEKGYQICPWPEAVRDFKKYEMLKEMTEHLLVAKM